MTNLSMGGVGFQLTHSQAIRFHPGTLLKGIAFEHHTLPNVRIDGEIRHILGQNLVNADGMVLVGAKFLSSGADDTLQRIGTFVEERVKAID
jgi:hypothetical protein